MEPTEILANSTPIVVLALRVSSRAESMERAWVIDANPSAQDSIRIPLTSAHFARTAAIRHRPTNGRLWSRPKDNLFSTA